MIPGALGTVGICGIGPPPPRGHAWAEGDILFLVDSGSPPSRGQGEKVQVAGVRREKAEDSNGEVRAKSYNSKAFFDTD